MREHIEHVEVGKTNHLTDLLLLLDQKVHRLKWGLISVSHFFTVRPDCRSNSVSSWVSPCVPLGSVERRVWDGVTDDEQRLAHTGSKDLFFCGVSPSVCVVTALKTPTSQTWGAMMCKRPQTDLKMLAENTSTPDPGKVTQCCENGNGSAISVSRWWSEVTLDSGSHSGLATCHLLKRHLSLWYMGVVILAMGALMFTQLHISSSSKSPDLGLWTWEEIRWQGKEKSNGENGEKKAGQGWEKGEDTIGLFSSTCWLPGLGGRQVKP